MLSHSQRLKNDVTNALDEYKNNKIYFSDTDSVYILKNDYEIRREHRLIGKKPVSIKKRLWRRWYYIWFVFSPKN